MDTLGPAIYAFLLLYRGFPLSEVKCISMVPSGLQNLSLIGRFFVLCPYFGESFKRGSTVIPKAYAFP